MKHIQVAKRRRKASELELLLVWQEGGPELRREFGRDFVKFTHWVDSEARRLLRSLLGAGTGQAGRGK